MNTDDAADPIERECEYARDLATRGRVLEAERAYQRVIATRPDHVEALGFLGWGALLRGEAAVAVEMFNRAAHAAPDNDLIVTNLALAYKAAGRLDSARYLLERVLRNQAGAFTARLHLGSVLELETHRARAFTAYLRAITEAQAQGHWISDATTPELLRGAVKHAVRFVSEERRKRLRTAIDQGTPAATLARVYTALDLHLGETQVEPRPTATFLYVPGLPPAPFVAHESMPWLAAIEAESAALRDEAQALGVGASAHAHDPAADLAPAPARWQATPLIHRGNRIEANCMRAPRTLALLEHLPLFRIAGEAPEVCFAMLPAGAEVVAPPGASNASVVVQLNLAARGDCGIQIAGSSAPWQAGRATVYDDSRGSRQWNRGDTPVLALMFNVWHPQLDDGEREATARLIEAIRELQRSVSDA